MNRLEIIQKSINSFKAHTYLEIGVEYGTVFLKAKASRKLAVDPELKIPFYKKLLYFRNLRGADFFPMPSDDFFQTKSGLFGEKKIDVAFIDGLHTYEQSWRDFENCFRYLSPQGMIIMHDCNPASAEAASPERSLPSGAVKKWNGDVWKTIVRLRCERNDLKVCVLDCDWGVGLIRRGKPESLLSLPAAEIAALGYEDLERHRRDWLNLRSPDHLEEFLKKT